MKLLSFVLLATAYGAFAIPGLDVDVSVTLPVLGEINLAKLTSVVHIDQSRAMVMKHRMQATGFQRRQSASVDAANTAVDFTVSVNVGQPSTQYTLLIDSGSSNTWVGAKTHYTPTSSSHNTGKSVSTSYGSGRFSGTEYLDTVDLGNGLVIANQSIGVANSSSGFDGSFDGILGIGPVDLTQDTIQGSSEQIPTVANNLKSQGKIGTEAIGIFYPPYAEKASGSLTFGGADASKYTGSLTYTPITASSPASDYWGIDQTISYAGQTIAGQTSGIVDSGTTMLLLASDHYQAYMNATGAVKDSKTGMLSLTKDQYAKLQPLDFTINNQKFSLSANGQIWPQALSTALGGDSDHVYLVVGDLGSESGEGFDFINGYMFMQRFYTVLDQDNSRVGFATTQYTDSTAN
ncbi:A1 family peptidase [Phanerochaete sordida]|uniref:A1 family peptidase n=1 Tax=Phanerochaete sordida TaxID=48140 RepID=A0A9P3GGZ8_9APHY|nr:A1 family peptidase [Phanerochaete sordida]